MYFKKDYESLKKNYEDASRNPQFKALISKLHLTEEEALTRTTKLLDILSELQNCQNCEGLYECKNALKGHINILVKKDETIYPTYKPCKYKMKEIKEKKQKMSEEQINTTARMKDIDVKDKKRILVIKWLDNFYQEFSFSKPMKGLYLHGNFGAGKTFLISALLHELKEKKDAKVKIIYFPETLRVLKSDWEQYEARLFEYQTIDILCIDDIGAEKVSEWGRDEVLGTILQYRMDNDLSTFFTSNFTIEELESVLSETSKGTDEIKARRIIERIKYLTIEEKLITKNKRA